MNRQFPRMFAAAVALCVGAALAQEADRPKTAPSKRTAAAICGHTMMSADERTEHMRKMHDAKTVEERDRYRKEHYEAMQARAKERGVTWREERDCRGPMRRSAPK